MLVLQTRIGLALLNGDHRSQAGDMPRKHHRVRCDTLDMSELVLVIIATICFAIVIAFVALCGRSMIPRAGGSKALGRATVCA